MARVRGSTQHSSSSSRSRRGRSRGATNAVRTLATFFGLDRGDRRRSARDRDAERRARHLARQHRRAEAEFQQRVLEGRATGQADAIRRASREAFERRERLPDAQIHLLAAIEGAHVDRPGHRRRLRGGLVVRLVKYGAHYYFLSSAGYFYKSTDRYGRSDDLDFVVDTWVPLTVRMFAQPYRQLCRR